MDFSFSESVQNKTTKPQTQPLNQHDQNQNINNV